MSLDTDLLIEVLNSLASGKTRPEDLAELQQAMKSGRVTIASNGAVAIGGNVSDGIVAGSLVLPREVLKLVQPVHRPQPLPPPDKLADRGLLPVGSRLPFPPNEVFTGRQDDLSDLAQHLLYSQEGPDQKVVLAGMGGLGKTQLAVEFCYRYGQFFQGVHWLQANLDIQSEVVECGGAMYLPYWPDTLSEQMHATLRAWKGGGRRLIVLDNAEDLKVIQDWLPRLRPACLLITSQRGAWPLDLGLEVKNLETLDLSQSIELLRKLAPRLNGESDESLNKLAHRLGDLPLALDLAGRYLADRPELSIEGYLAELDDAGSALEHTSLKAWIEHSPTGHPTSVAGTFILSWQRLTETDEAAKRLFRIGGYCAPNTPIPRRLLAKALGTDVPDHEVDRGLSKLYSLGLIDATKDDRWMHSLLAEFARLMDSDETESVLPILTTAMVELAQDTRKTRQPEKMIALWSHLCPVYRFSETAGLREAEALIDFLTKLDFSRPENSMYISYFFNQIACGPPHPEGWGMLRGRTPGFPNFRNL